MTLSFWAHSSAWLERIPDKDEAPGSSPGGPTFDSLCESSRSLHPQTPALVTCLNPVASQKTPVLPTPGLNGVAARLKVPAVFRVPVSAGEEASGFLHGEPPLCDFPADHDTPQTFPV